MAPRNSADILGKQQLDIAKPNLEDYTQVYSKQINEFLRCLVPFRYTKWTVGNLAQLASNCSVERYQAETVIHDSNANDFVYFVLKGSVRYVVDINVKRKRKKLQVCNLSYGQYFAVGENLPQGKVISNEDVICLLINKNYLTTNHLSFYEHLNDSLTTSLPTHQEILKRYIKILKWENFKKSVLQEALFQCQINRQKKLQFL